MPEDMTNEFGTTNGGERRETEPQQPSAFEELQNQINRYSNRMLHDVDARNRYENLLLRREGMYNEAKRYGFMEDAEEFVEKELREVMRGRLDWERFSERISVEAERFEDTWGGSVFTDAQGQEHRYGEKYKGIYKASMEGVVIRLLNEKEIAAEDLDPQDRLRIKMEEESRRFSFMPTERFQDELIGIIRKEARNRERSQHQGANTTIEVMRQADQEREAKRRVETEELYRKQKRDFIYKEYKQEFYTKFVQPGSEPEFYKALPPEQQSLWDNSWKLARAVYERNHIANMPDKYKDLSELGDLTSEKMEVLYRIEGVRALMQGYARKAVLGEPVRLESGREMKIWDCETDSDFERFREALRREVLPQNMLQGLQSNDALIREEADNKIKGADAIAWGLLRIGNLLESIDSRYSYSGERHGDLPSSMMSDEFRTVFHPQEKFENKCLTKAEWGPFGKWGHDQMWGKNNDGGLMSKIGFLLNRNFDQDKDELRFQAAPKGKFWTIEKAELKDASKRRAIVVNVPECHPVTTAKSFWEEVSVEMQGRNGATYKKSLLELLVEGHEIPWNQVKSGALGMWVSGKFNKGVQFTQAFADPQTTIDTRAPAWGKIWSTPINELFKSVKPEKELTRLRKDPSKKTYQTEHNLRVWAVFASGLTEGTRGVKNPNSSQPEFNGTGQQRRLIENVLRRVGYFRGGLLMGFARRPEGLQIT